MHRSLPILLAIASLLLFSCQEKEDKPKPVEPEDELVQKSLALRLKKLATKAAVYETGALGWEKGDTILYANPDNGIVRKTGISSPGGLVAVPFKLESSCEKVVAVYGGTELSAADNNYTLKGALTQKQNGSLYPASVFAGVLNAQTSSEQQLSCVNAVLRFSFGPNGVRTLVFRSADGTAVCSNDGQLGLTISNDVVSAGATALCDSISVAVTDDNTFYASILPCKLDKGYILRAYDEAGTVIASGAFPSSVSFAAGDLVELGCLDEVLTPTDGNWDFNWDGKSFFVTPGGAGSRSGKCWENAMSAADFGAILQKGITTEEVTAYLAKGVYEIHSSISDGYYVCRIEGGYPDGLKNRDLSGRDIVANETVISGGNNGRIFQINTHVGLYFDGVDFKSAKATSSSDYGGVVNLNNAYAVFQVANSRLYSNYAYRGGAVYVSSGKACFHNCVFENNSAHDRGGAFGATSTTAFLYFNKCSFVSNYLDGGEWGTVASCNGQSTVAMNNCVSHGNYSTSSTNDPTFNGQHNLTVSNCSFIESTQLRGILRLENSASGSLVNSIVINTADAKPAITMNNGQYQLVSYGHNIIGSVDGSGADAFSFHRNDKGNTVSLNAQWRENVSNYLWDEQPDDFAPASLSEVRNALPQGFLSWLASVDPDALITDRNGNPRRQEYLRPGSYEGTHINPTAKVFVVPSTTSYAMLREKVKLSFFNVYASTGISVAWGDGTTSNETLSKDGVISHEYGQAGSYTISVNAGGVTSSFGITVASLLSLDKALDELYKSNKCWVMNHRAHTADWSVPENSVAAVNASIAAGADCLETDTHITSDGVVVICHDQTINATTNGSGDITKMTLSQIKSYYLKDRNGKVTTEKMPTLEEFLLAARGKIYVNLDYSPRSASTAQVMAVVEKLGMTGQVLYYCNTEEKMNEALALNPDAQVYINHGFYSKLTGKGRYFIQATWNNTLTTSSGYAVNARNANSGGLLVSVNLLHVLSDYISDKHIDSDQVSSLFTVFPSCKMIMTDCPEELIADLATRGKR